MKYDEFEALLHDQLDRRQPVELTAEMRAAVAADPECLRLYQAHQAWFSQLPRLQAPRPPVDLASRVLLELQAGTQPASPPAPQAERPPQAERAAQAERSAAIVRPRRNARLGLVWTATAASVAILALAISTRWRQPDGLAPDVGEIAIQPNPAPEPAPAPPPLAPSPSLAGSFVDVRSLAQAQYQALAQETRASWSDLAVLMPQYPEDMIAEVDVNRNMASLPPVNGQADPATESDELQPFKQSTRGAVGLLMRFAP